MNGSILIPYYRTTKDSKVVWSTDTIVILYDDYLTISVNSIEETPIDEDDLIIGVYEVRKEGCISIQRSHICSIEWSWSKKAECYDISIYSNQFSMGYNCKTRAEAIGYYEKLLTWLKN